MPSLLRFDNSMGSCPREDHSIYSGTAQPIHRLQALTMTRVLAIAVSVSIFGLAPAVLALSPTAPAQNRAPRAVAPGLISQALLQVEDRGESVTQLQTQLSSLGYYAGPISGVFGALTESAVTDFQRRNGLSPDGIVGAETLAAIERATAAASSSARPAARLPVASGGFVLLGDAGADVTTLQQRLTTLGYYQGAVDGQFGSLTEAALIAFQQAQGLKPDGIAGRATFSALNAPTTPSSATSTALTAASQPQLTPAFPSPSGLGGSQPTAQTPASSSPVQPIQPLPDVSVLELQRQLTRQGLYSGPLDGILGPETQRAIAAAQRSHGINPGDINSQF